MKDEIKEKIKAKHAEFKKSSNEVINENIHVMSRGYKGNKVVNVCVEGFEANDALNQIENSVFDLEDTQYYNWLLGRKPISYLFSMNNRQRAESILAVVAVI